MGTDCSDAANPDLVVHSLKAIGNIGSFQKTDITKACIINKKNSLEVRISAIQAFRRFACSALHTNGWSIMNVLIDQDEDTEVRINSFQMAAKCSDDSQTRKLIEEHFAALIEAETNIQVN